MNTVIGPVVEPDEGLLNAVACPVAKSDEGFLDPHSLSIGQLRELKAMLEYPTSLSRILSFVVRR